MARQGVDKITRTSPEKGLEFSDCLQFTDLQDSHEPFQNIYIHTVKFAFSVRRQTRLRDIQLEFKVKVQEQK